MGLLDKGCPAGYIGCDHPKYRYKPMSASEELKEKYPGSHNEEYFLLIKEDEPNKGEIEVWNEDLGLADKYIGKYKKDENGKWYLEKNDKVFSNLKPEEQTFFASGEGRDSVIKQAPRTIDLYVKSECLKQDRADPAECDARAKETINDVLKDNKGLSPAQEQLEENNKTLQDDIAKAHQRKTYKNYTYPIDLDGEMQDFVVFDLVEYVPRKFSNQGGGGALKNRKSQGLQNRMPGVGAGGKNAVVQGAGTYVGDYNAIGSENTDGERKILASMYLPIPAGIADQNSVDWGTKELDPVQEKLAALAGPMTSGDAQGVQNRAGELGDSAGNYTGAAQAALIDNALSGADFAQREMGASINQNMELLFNGPKLRGFTFTFRLSARSSDEAETCKGIIRQFKQGMSPKKGEKFVFIKAPHTFFIGYYHKGASSSWLNNIKECALESMNVQYTPDGQYSTFYDGAITSYQIQLSFKELEPVFDSDYDDLDNSNENQIIGY